MDDLRLFGESFRALTGNIPFRWQERLFQEFVAGRIPAALDLPTGLGKTSVMAIWLIALADQARAGKVDLPRRLVHVVDRRTVVDQATDIVMELRRVLGGGKPAAVAEGLEKLSNDPKKLLAISTLRGEFADNKEWQDDPARAAIIVGTVDMIGSRLLLSGYGASRKMRPFHAGLIGQDTLIVHDEAHLSPAFGKLIGDIEKLQRAGKELRPIRVMDLSATQRDGAVDPQQVFSLTDSEKKEGPVQKRLNASKILRWRMPEKGETLEQAVAAAAAAYDPSRVRVVVYVRSPKTAAQVARILEKEKKVDTARIATLTGTIRGYERDQMASPSVPLESIADETARQRAKLFREFKAQSDRNPPEQTQYLVATSAGEVGLDLDADHMVCDPTTLDSMIQRFGRVNRLGERVAAIDVIVVDASLEQGDDDEELSDTEKRIKATKKALEALPESAGECVSPQAMRHLVDGMTDEQRGACFSKPPTMVTLTDILLDGWAMTSVEELPGRPQVARWLHGVEGKQPSLYVAWREEADEFVEGKDQKALKTLFDKHPVLARERLRGNLPDVVEELKKIARRLDREVVLLPARGAPEVLALADLVKKDNEDRLREATIVLPPDAGGLDRQGMLDGGAKERVADVADVTQTAEHTDAEEAEAGQLRRKRVLVRWNDEAGAWEDKELGGAGQWAPLEAAAFRAARAAARGRRSDMAEKEHIVLERDDEGTVTKALLLMTARGSLDAAEDSQDADGEVLLFVHNRDVAREAERIARSLGLPDPLREVLRLAGRHHDLGKDRAGWQKAIGHPRPHGDPGEWKPWAKSDRRGFDDSACGRYRHEFGSLRQASAVPEIAGHPERDLILHLIAAHHGWARPHFNEEHWDIEQGGYDENPDVAAQTPRRFARLQRRFGRWGLAWLESLLRAADYRVSSGRAGGDGQQREVGKERAA